MLSLLLIDRSTLGSKSMLSCSIGISRHATSMCRRSSGVFNRGMRSRYPPPADCQHTAIQSQLVDEHRYRWTSLWARCE
ncbi:uncharacterized protein DS421_14g464730 [Arachis hypogaea]|nr:uncharacterized protein DS421_14g464730 [Arachis hypogaea]